MLEHPYTDLTGGRWLRGNLHAHTDRSDGRRPAQEVVDDYADRGYDFLMLSDHDIYTSPADYAQLDSHGMILIPGNEVTAQNVHLLHVEADRLVDPDPDRQVVLDAIAQGDRGFAIVNHPNWQEAFDHCPMDRLLAWRGYTGLEIYNGVIGRLHGSPYATNKWDMLLSEGRRAWGFANDDSHLDASESGLGWNMVFLDGGVEPTVTSVVDALARGRFYASTGVTITGITVEGRRIRIETDNARRIVALCQIGRRFAQVDDTAIEVEAPPKATYVRFECWGDGESFAWTQPFFPLSDG